MPHRRLLVVLLAMLALAALAIGCGSVVPMPTAGPTEEVGTSAEPQLPARPVELVGTEWVLTSLNGRDPEESSVITLAFPNRGELGGNAGCNYYGARYSTSGVEFAINEQRIDRTPYVCDVAEGIMKQEKAYFEALSRAAAYRATESRLEIDDATGDTVLTFAMKEKPWIDQALDNTEWVLTLLNGQVPLQGTRITLAFADGRAGGFAGCNSYGGEFEAASEGLLAIPEVAITAEGCLLPEGVLEQEDVYVDALTSAATYRLEEDRLEITDAEGDVTLHFSRKEELPMEPGDLVGSRWQLLSMAGTEPAEGAPITLLFHSESQISGQAGCRGYAATYEANGDDIRLYFLGMTGPAEACLQTTLLQEGEYTTHLEQITNYRLDEDQLYFDTAPGAVLKFEPLPEDVDASLEDTTWALTSFLEKREQEGMEGATLLPIDLLAGTEITATFIDGKVHGSAGCNSYSGGYALSRSAVTFETPSATEMACLDPAGVMEQEQRYLAMLPAVSLYRIDGSQLWLETSDGHALVFTAQGHE